MCFFFIMVGALASQRIHRRCSRDLLCDTLQAPPSAFDNLMKVVTDSPTTSRRSSARGRTGSLIAPMSTGYCSMNNDVVLTTLPILSKEKNAAKRKELLLNKLDLCCHIFDFSPTAHTSDPVQTAKSKQAKTSALNDLVKFTTGKAEFMEPDVFPAYIKMISANLIRPLAPPDDPTAPPYDPEDDEPRLEPGWPHIELVYALLVRIVEHKSLSVDVALQSLTATFAEQLIDLFCSEDPRERDLLKTAIHRIYGQ